MVEVRSFSIFGARVAFPKNGSDFEQCAVLLQCLAVSRRAGHCSAVYTYSSS